MCDKVQSLWDVERSSLFIREKHIFSSKGLHKDDYLISSVEKNL
jgi:hypothetical protein